MSIYLLSLALIIGLKPILNVIRLENRKKTYVVIITVWLFLILALRADSVGRDLGNYIPWYGFWGRLQWRELWNARREIEYGYVLLNKLLYMVSPSPRLLLVFCAAVQMICYGYAVYQESEDPEFCFIIFITLGIYQNCASGLRQTTAACILMVAYHYIVKRNFKRFILFVLLAFVFHKSAAIFLPLYFLYGIRLRLRTILVILTSYLICLRYGSEIIKFIIRHTGYVRYFLSDYSLSENGAVGLLVMTSALIVVFLLIYMDDYNTEVSFAMFMLFIMEMFIILTFYLGIIARILKYFTFIATIAVPNLAAENGNKSNKNIVKLASCAVFFLYYLLILAAADNGATFTYHFMWQ